MTGQTNIDEKLMRSSPYMSNPRPGKERARTRRRGEKIAKKYGRLILKTRKPQPSYRGLRLIIDKEPFNYKEKSDLVALPNELDELNKEISELETEILETISGSGLELSANAPRAAELETRYMNYLLLIINTLEKEPYDLKKHHNHNGERYFKTKDGSSIILPDWFSRANEESVVKVIHELKSIGNKIMDINDKKLHRHEIKSKVAHISKNEIEKVRKELKEVDRLNGFILNYKAYKGFAGSLERICQNEISSEYGAALVKDAMFDSSIYVWYMKSVDKRFLRGFLFAKKLSKYTMFLKLVCSNRGEGTKLISYFLNWADKGNYKFICLEAVNDKVAATYSKRGFNKIYDERDGSFNGNMNLDVDAIIVRSSDANIFMVREKPVEEPAAEYLSDGEESDDEYLSNREKPKQMDIIDHLGDSYEGKQLKEKLLQHREWVATGGTFH
tara:strand:- start:3299 stop:4633 length:1335 start_codon:yes stop_codon:yes gene_type:complete